MADLVAFAMSQFAPPLIDRLGPLLGINRDGAERVLAGTVPAILAALAGLAARPGGPQKLASSVEASDPAALEDVARRIDGGEQQSLIDRGQSELQTLFGGSGATAFTSSIARFFGLGQGAASTLLGLITPILLGALGRQQTAQGLDAQGLADMLRGQRDRIMAALPPGLGKVLRFDPALETATLEMAGQKPQAMAMGPASTGINTSFGQFPRWLMGLIAAVIVALLAYWGWGNQGVREARETPPPASSTTTLDLNLQLSSTIDTVTNALKGVSDESSAKSALPPLADASARLEKLRGLADELPADAKSTLAGVAKGAKPELTRLIDQVKGIEGAGPVLEPVLDQLQSGINALAAP
ncbi:MAG TPA: DUF937 domain-containing protein [Stellaceae bacterium]|nr:DUF937 domain-containing protein [Stellaceae bacterium]